MLRRGLCLSLALFIAAAPLSSAQDIYMKDTPADTGVEPNPDPGWMWVTEDIWVRTTPDPGWQPYPFPEATPPWTPLPHQNPEYRDPKYSVPNYLYVRVRNRGTSASTGNERLRVYWAKASTGLSWPTQWVDYVANNCGPTKLFGAEVTKPRINAATATAAERSAYINAIYAIATNPANAFFGGVSYFAKQQEIHGLSCCPSNKHSSPAFLPWHREFVNRYEVLMREADPTVKLLYWDWVNSPQTPFDFGTSAFMGNLGAGTGGVSIGSPFYPSVGATLPLPAVTRDLGGDFCCPTPTGDTDASILGNANYPLLRPNLEHGPHDWSHVYIGGSSGDMSSIPTAARDPFFFLLHANVDRLWAQWQRNPSSIARLDGASASGTYGMQVTNTNITTTFQPWDGTGSTAIEPWTAAGGYIVTKDGKDPSIVSPPVYDTAPLTVPALQPGEAVILQIPWYPPNPADFSCFGTDQGHFCLLARIVTSASSPFGMTFAETADVNANTRKNNNIVWKNVTVVDNFTGAAALASVMIGNPFKERVSTTLRFLETKKMAATVFDRGRLFVDLKPELYRRWVAGGAAGRTIKRVDNQQAGTLEIAANDATVANIQLEPGETFSVDIRFELPKDYPLRRGPIPEFDLIQTGQPGKPEAVVGGQRFAIDVSKLFLIKTGEEWRYRDDAEQAPESWRSNDYDDSKWKRGKAELGYGDHPETTISGGTARRAYATAYFRRSFEVPDPGIYRSLTLRLKRDDGAIVYANGREVHRVNLPPGAVNAGTLATRDVSGVEEETFFVVKLDPAVLRKGTNVVAVEVHQSSLRSDDLSFDLELSANRADPRFAPAVAIAGVANGALFQAGETLPVNVQALDGDGKIQSVVIYVDGKRTASAEKAPYTFKLQARKGVHRIRAVATDNDQQTAAAFLTVNVIDNVPPVAALTTPSEGAMFDAGKPVPVSAQASDRLGRVVRVEFWVREATKFKSKPSLAATAKEPPFAAAIDDLRPGHYMLWAVAVDDGGETSQSMPVHIMVVAH